MSRFNLSEASHRLKRRYGVGAPYNAIHRLIINGEVDAERDETGRRWTLAESDLPRIAELLGIEPPEKPRPADQVDQRPAEAGRIHDQRHRGRREGQRHRAA